LPFRRVLFVAHRGEILAQTQGVFRRVRPEASTGFYMGEAKMPEADILLASVQTLGRQPHLRQFARDRFDYVVIDEFHHAAAPTYRALLGHFEPQFFLGLTATPDRSDGADLLALCGENLVYECDLVAGIRRSELSPFRYFGIPDLVDYERIPWRSNRFDEAALTEAVATRERADHALQSWRQHGGARTVAFCVSQRHADFMAAHFTAAGVPSVAVHTGQNSSPRTRSVDLLREGTLKVLFVVDLFNEGFDLPAIDTVLMLRPTASITLLLQQFGRGLRKSPGKSHLTVVDFVGNHRVFLTTPRALLGVDGGDVQVRDSLVKLRRSPEVVLPPGCSIHLDPEALDLLNQVLRVRSSSNDVEDFARDYLALHGRRPTATEVWHAGLDPKKNPFQSWTGLLAGSEDLTPPEARRTFEGLSREAWGFLRQLEVTPMSRSYKMLLLLAWIEAAAEAGDTTFPGAIGIGRLVQSVRRLASRSSVLQKDLRPSHESDTRLRRHLEGNPIAAWTDGKGTGGVSYFQYDGKTLWTRPLLNLTDPEAARCFREWAVELAEWRLAEYLGREVPRPFRAKVIHSSGNPILFLPARSHRPDLPMGWTGIRVEGAAYEANFVKIAINVVREPGHPENRLASILRKWFGPEAGQPGRRDQVRFQPVAGGAWEIFPEPGT
ncbi:MAG: DEAD/DEAH box helicase, partial [Verrucomicrobiota bacterium]